MVDSIRPTYRTIPTRRSRQSQGVESHNEKKHRGTSPLKERRKKKDRRSDSGNRSVYDMRHSNGRRKEDRGHPGIEVDV